jgi:prepilin-type processing-associated H-X9-DG protein
MPRIAQHSTARAPRAFTLIELLVVVSIIIALLAILLPGMKGAFDATHRAVCQSNIKQVALANASYAGDHEGHYPNKHTYLTTLGISPATFTSVPSKSVLVVGGYLTADGATRTFLCPADPLKREGGWNPIMPPSFSYARNAESLGGTTYVDVTLIRQPARHAMLLEEYELGPMNDGNFWGNPNDQLTQRHQGLASVAFFDSHTELVDAATYNGQGFIWRLDNYLDPARP